MSHVPWSAPASPQSDRDAGRALRRTVPRSSLAELSPASGRDPLAILDAQNASRVPELVPLRTERMSANPFAFYRGAAAIMASDLAAGPSSPIAVASCGDAHVSNFGFYASPQRTLVFDLNDFDEAAWAPWEWDLKRLVTSVVIAGHVSGRSDDVTADAARSAARQYFRALGAGQKSSPLTRYYQHFDAAGGLTAGDKESRKVLRAAIAHAQKRTGDRAARKMTATADDGRVTFVAEPPTTTAISADLAQAVEGSLGDYLQTVRADIRLLMSHYTTSDTARRVVGVGSVGTRCYISVFVDGDGTTLLLQTKEAGRSVLAEFGGCPQPADLEAHVASSGEGGRVVALQRILQGVSDPFLGYFRGRDQDYYVRQFRDMKGGIEAEELADGPFRLYAQACGAVLARAHGQSPAAAQVVGYAGRGDTIVEAIVAWSYAYAERSLLDYEAFIAR